MQANRSRTLRRTVFSSVIALIAATLALITIGAGPASATHVRATQMTWHAGAAPNSVEFHLNGAWRCTAFFPNCQTTAPANGTSFGPTGPAPNFLDTGTLDPGQGGLIAPAFTVVGVDQVNNVVLGEAHVVKQYPSAGPFNATFSSCCRLSGPAHINNADNAMSVTTTVNLAATQSSPSSSISPIVDCNINTICQFFVPASDADHQSSLQFRMATPSEAASGQATWNQPGPTEAPNAATIDKVTGLYRWNTAGAAVNAGAGGTYYSTQVIIEEVVSSVVVTKTAVDFFIRLNNTPNAQPVFVSPTPADGTVINTTVGSLVDFAVQATDPDAGDTVTPGMINKPAAATFTPVPGNPATANFSWTPTAAGTTIVTLIAQDQNGLGAVQRSVVINVANPLRDISVNDVTVNENAGTASFTVSLDSAAIGPISVDYATADGTAAQPGDYTKTTGTVNFAAGDISKTVTVPIIDDNTPETTETFELQLANPAGGTIVDGTGVGTITDTDRAISVDDVTVAESGGTATFTVTLGAAAAAPVSVNYATADGTATQPGDYTKTTGTLNFAVGETSKTVSVPITNDNAPEPSETFELQLSGASGGTITDGTGVGTITDADRQISVNDVTVSENTGSATFTVSLDSAAVEPVSVDFQTANDTALAPGDYTAASGSVNFAPGQATKSVTVTLTNDNTPEPSETFELRLSNAAGGAIVDGTGVGTITDSDRSISVSDVTVDESAGTAAFTVSLDAVASAGVSVNYATANGTAAQPGDYTATNGTVTFAPGDASKTVSVPIVDDNTPEPTETFELRLSGASGGTISDGTGVGTITDADRRISVNDVTVAESAGPATFTVSLDAAAVTTVKVNYATVNGTAAQPGDYTATNGTLTFGPGESSRTVSVPIINDNSPEPTETFQLLLSAPVGGTITDGTGVGTITDTDRRISVNDRSVNEAAGTATFTVSLDAVATVPVTVDYATVDGTATQPGDYTSTSGGLTFAAGQSTRTVSVPIIDDLLDEPAETYTLLLSNATGGAIVDGVGLGTIVDNDRNGAFYCRATGLRVGAGEAVVANGPGSPCADAAQSALTVPLGPIAASLVNAKTDQTPNNLFGTLPVNGDSAVAHSDTATVNFQQGAVSFRITAVTSDAKAVCSNGKVVLTGASSVAGLKLGNNLPYGVVRSYLRLNVPGLISLELNKKTIVDGKIVQQAVVITLLNSNKIVIGESIAGANGNPCIV